MDWNSINNTPRGVNLDDSDGVTVRVNQLGPWTSTGRWVGPGSSDNSITSNKLTVAYIGIVLSGDAANNKVCENTIVNSEFVGFAAVSTGGGNSVTDNVINEAPFGIWTTSSADTIGANKLVNVVVWLTANPFI